MGILEKIKKPKAAEETAAKRPTSSSRAKKTEAPESAQAETPAKKALGASLAYRVLVQPMVSEKATQAEMHGTYTFMVAAEATKTEIAVAIEQVYGVKPEKVRTINVEGKRLRFGRFTGRRKDFKKAIVTLPKGATISIHEGV